MNVNLDPRSWLPLPAYFEHGGEHADYLDDEATGETTPRFNIFQTDDGWAIQATVRVSGGAVARTWMLPDHAQAVLLDAYDALEEVLVWESGIGLQVEIEIAESP